LQEGNLLTYFRGSFCCFSWRNVKAFPLWLSFKEFRDSCIHSFLLAYFLEGVLFSHSFPRSLSLLVITEPNWSYTAGNWRFRKNMG
jgi:hypothetical protein